MVTNVKSALARLDEKEEAALTRALRDGESDAIERLALGTLRIAVDEAIRTRGLGLRQGDLVRLGVSALVGAMRTYDPTGTERFSEHVRARIRRVLRESVS